jgi:hypothetical protein
MEAGMEVATAEVAEVKGIRLAEAEATPVVEEDIPAGEAIQVEVIARKLLLRF